MKNLLSFLTALAILNLLFVSCEREEKKHPPELPPYESMVIDFSKFGVQEKNAIDDLKSTDDGTKDHYQFAAFHVGLFSVIIIGTLAIPVTAFATAMHHQPEFIGDATWQWSYTVDGFASNYTARLTGKVRSSDVLWEMYISKSGIGAFEEFKWYEGTSQLDGAGGQWILNHSVQYSEPMLQIDWELTGDEVGEVKYTNIRVLDNLRNPNPSFGSYIQAGKLEADLNAYYNIHINNSGYDVFIEWSTTEYFGRVKAETSSLGPGWHCWDSFGYDIQCTE